jgi:hypothetical protein
VKSRKIVILLGCLMSLLCSSLIVSAQLEKETALTLIHVRGTVYDKAGKSIPDAKVELLRNDAVVLATTSDASGGFRFDHVDGHYLLRVTESKYSPATREILVEWKLGRAVELHNLFVLLGPSVCADSCSMIVTSKKEFEEVTRRNKGH